MVAEVKNDGRGRMVTSGSAEELRVKSEELRVVDGKSKSKTLHSSLSTLNSPPPGNGLGYCPACKTGHVVRGKTAFGCVRFREGCTFRLPAEIHGKKLSDPQVKALLAKGRTPVMKGFIGAEGQKFDAAIGLDTAFQPILLQVADSKPGAAPDSGQIPCPVCKLGTMLKGQGGLRLLPLPRGLPVPRGLRVGRQAAHRNAAQAAAAARRNQRD